MTPHVAAQSKGAHVALLGSAITLLLSACNRDHGPAPAPIPAYSERASYEALIAKIDRAEAIADPMRRCLEYPDLPNAPWPRALIEALCADEYTDVPQADFVRGAIEREDWNGLHAYYARRLADHRSGKDPEYVLYRAFLVNSWRNLDEGEAYTRRWVAARPSDPFANTALAKVLAWKAYNSHSEPSRGRLVGRAIAAAVDPTSDMNEEAIELAMRAIVEEPDLMPAYDLLIKTYSAEGRPDEMWRALDAAKRRSPAAFFPRSSVVSHFNRNNGGKPGEIEAFAADAAKHVRDNPRLAEIASYPLLRKARSQALADRHGPALAGWRQVLASTPDYEALLNGGYDATQLGRDFEGLMYFSQYIRFEKSSNDALLRRGRIWERSGDPKRALRDYQTVLKNDPNNAKARERIAEVQARSK